jgi:hypothetical protein
MASRGKNAWTRRSDDTSDDDSDDDDALAYSWGWGTNKETGNFELARFSSGRTERFTCMEINYGSGVTQLQIQPALHPRIVWMQFFIPASRLPLGAGTFDMYPECLPVPQNCILTNLSCHFCTTATTGSKVTFALVVDGEQEKAMTCRGKASRGSSQTVSIDGSVSLKKHQLVGVTTRISKAADYTQVSATCSFQIVE